MARNDAAQNVLNFQYSLTATSVNSSLGYTGVSALDFAALHFGSATGGIDGNAPANRTALSAPVTFANSTWDPGETLFIRWRDPDDAGSDQGLAIDDLSFAAVPEPSAATLAAIGLAALAAFGLARAEALRSPIPEPRFARPRLAELSKWAVHAATRYSSLLCRRAREE